MVKRLIPELVAKRPANHPQQGECLLDALRALLSEPQFSAKSGVCVGCGANAEFQRMTVFLWNGDETTELTLPVCKICASLREPMIA